MQLQYNKLNSGTHLLKVIGKLDIVGTGEIETKFAGYCAGNKVPVIVDLSEVDFLASIGIRLLVVNAKSVAQRGGKMVLLNPIPDVNHVLDLAGIPEIIPTYTSLEAAEAILREL